jgi:hypothetical protein
MFRFIKILKRVIFPITLLTIVTLLSIIIAINSLYVVLINNGEGSLYAAVAFPIALFLILLYALDRLLIKKISYTKLMLAEMVIGISLFFIFLYQNRSTDINFITNQDYALVLFDSEDNSQLKFTKKPIFGKELNVYDTNIIHLDPSISLRKDLRIRTPKQWESCTQYRSSCKTYEDSIEYIFISKKTLNPNRIKDCQTFIDSLLNVVD